jgi:hypothetical protein
MEENRIPKRAVYMNLETTRLRGRPRNRWQDEVRDVGRRVGTIMQLSFKFWFLHTTQGKFQCWRVDVRLCCSFLTTMFHVCGYENYKIDIGVF